MNETIQTPYFEAAESSSTHTSVQETECTPDGSQDMQLHLSEDLLIQATTSIKNDDEENAGAKEMHETIQRLLVQNAEDMLIPASIQDIATETHVMHESIDKPFAQATQNAWDITIVQKKEANEETEKPLIQTTQEAHSSATIHDIADGTQEIHDTIQTDQDTESLATTRNRATIYQSLSQAPELATAQNTEESYDSYIETQEKWDTVKKPSSPTAQNVRNSTMILDAEAIDQSPSKAPEPLASPILESSAYSDKWLIDISKQNLPYLEAGLKRHPQVFDWFNAKRRRAFAALFTEVTCILRTTRRCNLTENDRNYIRECCTALEAVDFDASWLSYVYGCIESCGDGNELMRKLEETEAKASTLRNELASVEESLVSLRDEASRLHTFIEE